MKFRFFRKPKDQRDYFPCENILISRPLRAQTRVLVNESVWRRHALLVTLSHTIRKNSSYFKHLPKVAIQFSEKRAAAEGYHPIYCEHGWLPRDEYQISSSGVNQRHHVAAILAEGPREFTEAELVADKNRIDYLRAQFGESRTPAGYGNEPFFVFSLQMTNDLNLHRCGLEIAKMADKKGVETEFKETLSRMMSDAAPGVRMVFLQHPAESVETVPKLSPGHEYIPRSRNIRTLDLALSPACQGVITINSNAMNEALLFGRPVFQLGDFLTKAFPNPHFPYTIEEFLRNPAECAALAKRDSYLGTIFRHQRSLQQMTDPSVVREMIETEVSRGTL